MEEEEKEKNKNKNKNWESVVETLHLLILQEKYQKIFYGCESSPLSALSSGKARLGTTHGGGKRRR